MQHGDSCLMSPQPVNGHRLCNATTTTTPCTSLLHSIASTACRPRPPTAPTTPPAHLRPRRSWPCTSTTVRRCLSHLGSTAGASSSGRTVHIMKHRQTERRAGKQARPRPKQAPSSQAVRPLAHVSTPSHINGAYRIDTKKSSAKPQNMVRQRACRKPRRLSRSSVACACACTQPLACGAGQWGLGGGKGACTSSKPRQRRVPLVASTPAAHPARPLPQLLHFLLPSSHHRPPPAHPGLHRIQRRIEVQRLQVPRVVRALLCNAAAPEPLVVGAPAAAVVWQRQAAQGQRSGGRGLAGEPPAAAGGQAATHARLHLPTCTMQCPVHRAAPCKHSRQAHSFGNVAQR